MSDNSNNVMYNRQFRSIIINEQENHNFNNSKSGIGLNLFSNNGSSYKGSEFDSNSANPFFAALKYGSDYNGVHSQGGGSNCGSPMNR